MNNRFLAILLCGLAIPAGVRAGSFPELGRLLTTPEERARLETFRHQRTPDELSPEPGWSNEVAGENPASVEESRVYTLKGLVRRADGRHVVWLNEGSTLTGSITAEGAYVEVKSAGSGAVQILLPDDAGRVVLKPGQSFDTATGKIYDVIDKGPVQQALVSGETDTGLAGPDGQDVDNGPSPDTGKGEPADSVAPVRKK
ncbi:MAG: hypothetical protein V1706_07735 [Pseudomonadota bacterium]